MEMAKPPKRLRGIRFQQNIQALRIIAQQRPDDPEAQRRAQVATDLYFQSWPRRKLPTSVIKRGRAKCRRQTSRAPTLPTEIYEMILGYVITDYPTCKLCRRKRARTLLSLTCSCRLFQRILEKYLYTHPQSRQLYWGHHPTLLFRLSLAIEPRRGLLVQSLTVTIRDPYRSYLWLEIAKLCPNLSHLEIEENIGLSRPHLGYLEELFSACPNVTKLSLNAKTSDSVDSLALVTNPRFLKFWNQLTHVVGLPCSLSSEIISISKGCPSLERLKISYMDGDSPYLESLLDASRIWGKTLRTLYLDLGMTTRFISIAEFLEHLPVVEEVCLDNTDDAGALESIQALARQSPPRLKRFKAESFQYRGYDPGLSRKLSVAMCDMITAQADTLEIISLTGLYYLNMSVLGTIKKAKKVEFLHLPLDRRLDDEECKELPAACPKLQCLID